MALDFAALKLKPSPNQYLAAPEGVCQADHPHRLMPDYQVGVSELRDVFLDLIRSQPRVSEEAVDGESYEFVQRTRWLGFPDEISVQFFDRGRGRSSLAIYSRSRYGWSDLGANRARVDAWLDALAARIKR